MKITICIGSSCHLKGSRQIVEGLQELIDKHGLTKDKVELEGTFCMGQCQTGVNVKIDGEVFSVKPDTVNEFFEKVVLPRVGA